MRCSLMMTQTVNEMNGEEYNMFYNNELRQNKPGKFFCFRNFLEPSFFGMKTLKSGGNTIQNVQKNDFCTQLVYSLR